MKKMFLFFFSVLFFLHFLPTAAFADTTSSNCFETAVGNPPANDPGGCANSSLPQGTASDLADFAQNLTKQLIDNPNCFHIQSKDAYLRGFAYISQGDIGSKVNMNT